jgi:hypothetical protein
VCDPLGVRLCLADERRQTLAQIGSRFGVEAVVDLAGIDEVLALAAGQVDAVPFLTVEGKAGDCQRLTLLAGFFDPDVALMMRSKKSGANDLKSPKRRSSSASA